MKVLASVLSVIVLLCLGIGLVACGSSETKTVTETETVTSEAADEESGQESSTEAPESSESATTDQPTATTIPDGTWKKGEYTPGTYRAKGGNLCSWEKREKLDEEAEGTGNWGGSESNILAEIDSEYFITEECGVWQKVG